jgi:ferredoxin
MSAIKSDLLIESSCINCDVCEPACPNEAIFFDATKEYYQIDNNKCTLCHGHYESPQCIALCPVACITHKN